MLSLIALVIVTLLVAARGLLLRNKVFEFPTVIAMLYIAFFIPQALTVERDFSGRFETWIVWLYMTACLLMTVFGFEAGKRLAKRRAVRVSVPGQAEDRLMIGAVVLAGIGLIASSQVRSIASASDLGSEWTGVVTAWYLLIQTTFFALALSTLRFLKTRRVVYLGVACVALVAVLIMVGQNVKRHMIAETAIILAGAWFFVRGQQPGKIVLLVGFFLGTVLLHQVGSVRGYVADGRGNAFEAFAEGVPFEEFEYFNAERAPELTQATVDIDTSLQSGIVEGPADLWNKLVHQYVPAFLLGREFKDSLKIQTYLDASEDYQLSQFFSRGSTRTGFSDSFRAYSVLGCLVFLALGIFMGSLFTFAIQGRFWAQFYYLVLLNDGMIAFTEETSRFVVTLPMLFLLTYLIVRPVRPGRPIPAMTARRAKTAGGGPRRPAWQSFRA